MKRTKNKYLKHILFLRPLLHQIAAQVDKRIQSLVDVGLQCHQVAAACRCRTVERREQGIVTFQHEHVWSSALHRLKLSSCNVSIWL